MPFMEKQNKILHFLKFSGISMGATFLEYILFYFITPLLCLKMSQPVADGLSTAICYVLASILCYILNKIFVFKTENKSIKEAIKFFAVATPKMLITTFAVPAVIAFLNTDLNIVKTIINICIQTILFFVGYVFQKIWVFKKDSDIPSTNN